VSPREEARIILAVSAELFLFSALLKGIDYAKKKRLSLEFVLEPEALIDLSAY
jgi:hypothetical protein